MQWIMLAIAIVSCAIMLYVQALLLCAVSNMLKRIQSPVVKIEVNAQQERDSLFAEDEMIH